MPAVEELIVGTGPVYPGRDRLGNKVSCNLRFGVFGMLGRLPPPSQLAIPRERFRSHGQVVASIAIWGRVGDLGGLTVVGEGNEVLLCGARCAYEAPSSS